MDRNIASGQRFSFFNRFYYENPKHIQNRQAQCFSYPFAALRNIFVGSSCRFSSLSYILFRNSHSPIISLPKIHFLQNNQNGTTAVDTCVPKPSCHFIGVTGFEPAASTSQTSRATSCATPRFLRLSYCTTDRRFCQYPFCIGNQFDARQFLLFTEKFTKSALQSGGTI